MVDLADILTVMDEGLRHQRFLGKIEGNGTGRPVSADPGGQILADVLKKIKIQLGDQMIFLQQGQEHFGGEHTLLGMTPTGQSLRTHNALVAEANLGLQIDLKISAF